MKTNHIVAMAFCALASFTGIAIADTDKQGPEATNLWDCHRAGSRAPIGVMGDHTHKAGEFMLSYRYMYMSMGGHRAGTDSLESSDVFHRGFGVAATGMEMHMHMVGGMFAPTDWLTLAAMVNYVQKDMSLVARPVHGHGHGDGHGHTRSFGHSSEGWGDVTLTGLVKIFDANRQRVHLNLGLIIPSAEVDHKQNGAFLPYGMQSGTGSWGLKPGITYLGQADWVSWGAQASALVNLDDNDSGFRYGDGANVTAWVAVPLSDQLSVSVRADYTYQDSIQGHYNGPHGHVAPPHFTENYGGHTLELGLGINFLVTKGLLKGQRLAVEATVPVYQDLNGVGMEREWGITAGIQKSF